MRVQLAGIIALSVLAFGLARERTAELFELADPAVEAALGVAYGTAKATPVTPHEGPVVLTIDGRDRVAEVDERFLSVALDTSQLLGGRWWSRDARQVEVGRGDSHAPPFDLARARLRTLAAALAPAYLRIGGTEADVVYYDMTGEIGRPAPRPYELVLTRARWDEVNAFARDVGYQVLFTVNAGPGPRGADGRWTSQNADSLLEYSRAAGYDVPVWELGNEVDAYWFTHGLSHRVGGAQYARDLARFRSRVKAVFPEARVAGPGAFYWPVMGEPAPFASDFMRDYLRAGGGGADVVTWHFYPQQSRRCPVATRRASASRLLDPAALDEAARWAEQVDSLASASPGAEVWLGETGNAQCGGEPGVSDRFVGSLWWVDELGLAATHGQRVVVRQTLAGSNYGLVDDERVAPNPDYWASLLWKRTMGRSVLGVRRSNDDPFVRAYAHCSPSGAGAVTVLAVNLHPDRSAGVRIDGLGTGSARTYRVTSPSLTSSEVDLNGAPLRFDADLPRLEPALGEVANGAIDLPAASYAFVELPGASAPACGGDR